MLNRIDYIYSLYCFTKNMIDKMFFFQELLYQDAEKETRFCSTGEAKGIRTITLSIGISNYILLFTSLFKLVVVLWIVDLNCQ